jgi:hypothetical protein
MGTSGIKEPETEIKNGKEDIEPTAPAVATACCVHGNVKFEDSPQNTSGPATCKIKINFQAFPSVVAKESQSK